MATLWTWDPIEPDLFTPEADDVLAPDSWDEAQVRAFLVEKGIAKGEEDEDSDD
jgi:hypothetical protein